MIRSRTSRPERQRGRGRFVGLVSATAGAMAVAMLALPTPALAASSTTVVPAGDHFSVSLVSGGSAVLAIGSTNVTCNTSNSNGAIPTAPANHNDNGPVTVGTSPATFSNGGGSCPTNIPLTTATTTTSGAWSISLQFVAGSNTSPGVLTIAQKGAITKTSGLASCTITVAPNGPANVSGTLTRGSGSTLPTLAFNAATLPISVTGGFGCPTAATSATITAKYNLADTTNPSALLDITA